MPHKDVDLFVRDHAMDKNGIQKLFKSSKPERAFKNYPELNADERALLLRKNAMEIRSYLKDAYGASLSINIP